MACSKDPALKDLPPPMPRDAAFRRGVSLGLFASTRQPEEQRRIYRMLLGEIAALGATDVELVVEGSQRDVRAAEIIAQGDSEDALLGFTIDQAHALGLRVFLMPILRLEERQGDDWRGKLRPDDRPRWWSSYGDFILRYAALAAAHRVELYAVGSELISMESEESRWRALIAQVRARYSGALTYSANWDHFEPVGFFDALDIAGVTAYQPLAADPSDRREEALDRAWRPFQGRLKQWAAQANLRYLFTEVGYPSSAEGALRPWDYRPRGAIDLQLQLECYRSLFRTWHADQRLGGVYVWNWFGPGGPEDPGYSPRGKPAAKVLAHWYR